MPRSKTKTLWFGYEPGLKNRWIPVLYFENPKHRYSNNPRNHHSSGRTFHAVEIPMDKAIPALDELTREFPPPKEPKE